MLSDDSSPLGHYQPFWLANPGTSVADYAQRFRRVCHCPRACPPVGSQPWPSIQALSVCLYARLGRAGEAIAGVSNKRGSEKLIDVNAIYMLNQLKFQQVCVQNI